MNYKECIDLLLKEFPEFYSTWEQHLSNWNGETRTIGLDITAFSDFISSKLGKNENFDYKRVFDFIEKILIEGDENVQTAASTMFLENLINQSSNGNFDSRKFTKYLNPKSIEYCLAWDKFSGGKTPGLYDD